MTFRSPTDQVRFRFAPVRHARSGCQLATGEIDRAVRGRGYASPEGDGESNRRLAREGQRRSRPYLRKRVFAAAAPSLMGKIATLLECPMARRIPS